MDLNITTGKADWNTSPHGKSRDVVIVSFPNCHFKWLPTYSQLEDIKKALDAIEIKSWGKAQTPDYKGAYLWLIKRLEMRFNRNQTIDKTEWNFMISYLIQNHGL